MTLVLILIALISCNSILKKETKSDNVHSNPASYKIELIWESDTEGLHGPKGMRISGCSLFIADIGALVEANIKTDN